jgi:DNA-binding transcriptional LysR family regulator
MRHDLTSLHIFLCVAEEKSLTRASKRAHLAVSAISKRIAELESRTGTPLFNRRPRGMDLTPAGQSMLAYTRKVFDTLNQLDTDMDEFSDGIKGQIKVFASISALTQFLPADIETFAVLYPGIKFDIEERVGAAIIRAIQDGRADIGIFASHTPAEDLETLAYRSDRLGLAVPEDHPLAKRDSVRFSEALEYEFVGSHVESALFALLNSEAEKLDNPPPHQDH